MTKLPVSPILTALLIAACSASGGSSNAPPAHTPETALKVTEAALISLERACTVCMLSGEPLDPTVVEACKLILKAP